MTAGERGRSIAPTCQDVSLEFKCILFNRWSSERAFQPFGALSLFPSTSLLSVALFSPCPTVFLPSSYWEYSLITCASLQSSFMIRLCSAGLCSLGLNVELAVFSECELKACRKRSRVFRWDQPEKRRRNIPVQRASVDSVRILCYALLHCYVSRRMVYSINRW